MQERKYPRMTASIAAAEGAADPMALPDTAV
jgi:hypothetical protein